MPVAYVHCFACLHFHIALNYHVIIVSSTVAVNVAQILLLNIVIFIWILQVNARNVLGICSFKN